METGVVRFIGRVENVDGDVSTIVIRPEYCQGLMKLDMYSQIVVVYWFHERDDDRHRGTLQVVPRRHGETELRGVFASRSPSRPNPLGITTVELLSLKNCKLTVRGLDAHVGSPVVDIKPVSVDRANAG